MMRGTQPEMLTAVCETAAGLSPKAVREVFDVA